jgi:hypothetical protein
MATTSNFLLFAQEAGKDIKALRTYQRGTATDLTALATTAKDNLVNAINETYTLAKQAKDLANTSVYIVDGLASDASTYSSQKIEQVVGNSKNSLGGTGLAAATYKTIDALSAKLDEVVKTTIPGLNASVAATINFVDYSKAQTLTQAQKDTACNNIGALSLALFGDPNTDFLAAYNAAKA